jgi:O-acetyl-ADP-ribose deacetylase (regulator of RNase III)
MFPKGTQSSILINPSNPELSGTSNFPYFPKGGPVPSEPVETMHKDWQPLGYVSHWGSMNTGDGILFPISAVDGLVHQLGGWRLRLECRWKQLLSNHSTTTGQPCPVGAAVGTWYSGPELEYDQIVHTTPPFYDKYHDNDTTTNDNNTNTPNHHQLLQQCYRNALSLAFATTSTPSSEDGRHEHERRVACPLLGAGARGFPSTVAIQIAAEQAWEWQRATQPQDDDDDDSSLFHEPQQQEDEVLAFGLLDPTMAKQLAERLDATILVTS